MYRDWFGEEGEYRAAACVCVFSGRVSVMYTDVLCASPELR